MAWPHPIDHVFILCNKEKEYDRLAYLQKWLDDHKIDPKYYTFTCATYGDTLDAVTAWKHYNPWQTRVDVLNKNRTIRSANSYNLKKGEISLCINWGHAAQMAIDGNYNVVMFLESDILFDTDFLIKLETAMSNMQKYCQSNWDFLSISAGANLRPERPDGETHLKWFSVGKDYHHTRTTDAMIFNVKFLKTMLPTFFPIAEVLDWELNYHLTRHKSRSFWLDPPILRQGSAIGVYKTHL
jgi:hypothetical protein